MNLSEKCKQQIAFEYAVSRYLVGREKVEVHGTPDKKVFPILIYHYVSGTNEQCGLCGDTIVRKGPAGKVILAVKKLRRDIQSSPPLCDKCAEESNHEIIFARSLFEVFGVVEGSVAKDQWGSASWYNPSEIVLEYLDKSRIASYFAKAVRPEERVTGLHMGTVYTGDDDCCYACKEEIDSNEWPVRICDDCLAKWAPDLFLANDLLNYFRKNMRSESFDPNDYFAK